MRTTIDRAGRIVVPKALRDQLSLTPGLELELTASEGHLEIEPVSTPMRLERRDGRLVAVAEAVVPPLTEQELRATLELVREKQ
jgi:AbrB family looped-hinge helix DNA binding protein